MIRSIALALGLIVLSTGTLARPDEPEPGASPPARSSHVERVTSEIVLIDAYVTDSQDRPVRGLTLDDFVLEVDGYRRRPVTIEFHDVATVNAGGRAQAGTASTETPGSTWPRRFAFFFDDRTSGPLGLTRARQAVDRFLDSGMTPTDQVALVAHDHGLRILQDFTSDRAALHGAMERSLKDAARFNTFTLDSMNRWTEIAKHPTNYQITALCEEEKIHYVGVVKSLETLVTSLGPWRGYKAVVFMGDGIPESPMERWYQALYTAGMRNIMPASHAPATGRSTGAKDPPMFAMECTLSTELKTVGRAASAAGVTLDTIQTIGLAAGTDARMDQVAKQTNALQMLALNTGGRYSNSNDVLASLTQFEAASRVYYTLGYIPEGEADGKYHPLVVRCLRKGFKIRSRHGYTRLPPAEAHARNIEAAHAMPEMYSRLEMSLSEVAGPLEGSARVVDLVVHVPPGKILFLPEEGVPTAHLSVGLVALDDGHREQFRTSHGVRIKKPVADAAGDALGLDLYCRVRLPLDPLTVTAVVSDESADVVGGARLHLSRRLPDDSLAILGLSLYALAEKSLWIEVPPKPGDKDGEDGASAYTLGPAMKGVFAPDEAVVAGFKLAPKTSVAPGSLRLEIRQGTEIVRSRPIDIGEVAAGPSIKVPLPVAGLAAGDYVVSIRQVVAEEDRELTSNSLRIEAQVNAGLQP
jgi:VWFA-related protein